MPGADTADSMVHVQCPGSTGCRGGRLPGAPCWMASCLAACCHHASHPCACPACIMLHNGACCFGHGTSSHKTCCSCIMCMDAHIMLVAAAGHPHPARQKGWGRHAEGLWVCHLHPPRRSPSSHGCPQRRPPAGHLCQPGAEGDALVQRRGHMASAGAPPACPCVCARACLSCRRLLDIVGL